MGLKLEKVVPWGRSAEEYIRMFDLKDSELQGSIIDCAGGPASFNAQMTRQGHQVISCDPLYQFSPQEIAQRIEQTYPIILEGVRANLDNYIWQEIPSPTQLGQIRMAAMNQFLADFPQGLKEGRYRTDELPILSFASGQFDLALCSHFLFTYSDYLSLNFHREAILEMCRVAREVRIFPLLNVSGELSPFLSPLKQELERQGYTVRIRQVGYAFQQGGDRLLTIRSH